MRKSEKGVWKWIHRMLKTGDKSFHLEAAVMSRRGKVREKNEDNFYFMGQYLDMEHGDMAEPIVGDNSKEPFYIGVFDGMGGESAGELASYVAVCGLAKRLAQGDTDLAELLLRANDEVYGAAVQGRYQQIGTTATIMEFRGKNAVIANLGDSPAYLWQNGNFTQITKAHTNEEFLRSQGIKRKPALTQFLGINPQEMLIEPYKNEILLKRGQKYLLCSDGLTDMLQEEDIARFMAEGTSEETVTALMEAALDRGGIDNITIIVCTIA